MLEEELASSKDAAQKLPALRSELDTVTQSNAELQNRLEALEKTHCSMTETKSALENALTEKADLISTMEKEAKELAEKMRNESESHTLELQKLLTKEKLLKEQLGVAKQTIATAKSEASTRRDEIKTMKTTLSAASQGLEERDGTIKSLKDKLNKAEAEHSKTSELLKEKVVAMNKITVGWVSLFYSHLHQDIVASGSRRGRR